MIAGIFPVAIQQTAVVTSETQGSLITRDAIRKIQNVADQPGANTLFPTTGTSANPAIYAITTVAPAPGSNTSLLGSATPPTGLLPALGADSLYSADKRFGWVGFYRRDQVPGSAPPQPIGPYANIYVIALQNSNFANYLYLVPTSGQTTISASVPPPVPPYIYGYPPQTTGQIPAMFFYNADGTTTILMGYNTSATLPQSPSPNFSTGAYVLISTATGAPAPGPGAPPSMIGRFFRLGNATTFAAPAGGAGTITYVAYVAQSGWDITPADAAANTWTPSSTTPAFTANVFCIGAAPAFDSTNGYYDGPFTGPNQDIGVASAFIRINTANN